MQPQPIVIEQRRIFIEGIETSDPVLIGYAIIDLVQDGKDIIIKDSEENIVREPFFSQTQIGHLQSKIHKITGDGEVMGLFNEMLGINAG